MGIACQIATITAVGSVSVSSTPTGATILLAPTGQTLVNYGPTGAVPVMITGLVIGSYDIKLTLSGYQDYTATIAVSADITTTVSQTLTLSTGSVYISSTPAGASITIDGVLQGILVTPQTISGLTPVLHTYELSLIGYTTATGNFTVPAGDTVNVNVTLLTIASIEATNISVVRRVIPCIAGDISCIVDVTVTWRNNGQTSGMFTPNIKIDNILLSPAPYPAESLAGLTNVQKIFAISGLTAGDHTICPSPNYPGA